VSFDFTVSDVIPTSAMEIYNAWLSSDGHTGMTGSEAADISSVIGVAFTVWDCFINGKNLELDPGKRIVQSWRTTRFKDDDPDSKIEVTLTPAPGGTRVTVRHTGVPDGQTSYRDGGWQRSYFDPMKVYFAKKA
jgi:activator of HSP90 ATPase